MKKLSFFIIRFRKFIIVTTLLLTGVLAIFFKDLKVDPDVFNYLPDDDPKAMLFREIGINTGGTIPASSAWKLMMFLTRGHWNISG
jgi:predicted RND superfamily exporter protein